MTKGYCFIFFLEKLFKPKFSGNLNIICKVGSSSSFGFTIRGFEFTSQRSNFTLYPYKNALAWLGLEKVIGKIVKYKYL